MAICRVTSLLLILAHSFSGLTSCASVTTISSIVFKRVHFDTHQTDPIPEAETISVIELPLPPVINANIEVCSVAVNPRRTGCINETTSLQSGSFTADGRHVTAYVNFVGALDSLSIYSGDQIIVIKTDGNTFDNGDSWKCLTCGITRDNQGLDYPQAFKDGKRLLAGTNIVSCGKQNLVDKACLSEDTKIYPIYWNVHTNGSGPSGSMRELRIHPDGMHLAWSSFTSGGAGQLGYIGRLYFNAKPTNGQPLIPRYDLTNVNVLVNSNNSSPLIVSSNNELTLNSSAITIGEIRGFSGTGNELTYIGYPQESCNIDVFAVSLFTGAVRRLTSHPEYVDPVDISPDDNWTVAMDTRGSGRQMFLAGMRYIPPIIDMLVTSVTASTRNNGQRRFFQPWLIDRSGDRGSYFGQQVNGEGDASPGSINDPNWNGLADPKFSPDGTQIVYHQGLVIAPACGGENPLPCPSSTAEGARTKRIMLATLEDRQPLSDLPAIVQAPDSITWATPYMPGNEPPINAGPVIPPGRYTLFGSISGFANVTVTGSESIAVKYTNFSQADSKGLVLDGYENVTVSLLPPTLYHVDWFSDLNQTRPVVSSIGPKTTPGGQLALQQVNADIHGTARNTKKTSADGFHISIDIMTNIFDANGTLITIVDGVVWTQPQNGT